MITILQLSAAERAATYLFFAGVAVAVVVGLVVGLRAFQAYRRTGRAQLLQFSVGLLLLVSVSTVANVVLASLFRPTSAAGPVTELVRLAGAVVMLYAVYDRPTGRERRRSGGDRNAGDASGTPAVVPPVASGVALQVTVEETPTSAVESVVVAALVAVGCLLSYQAYRGFRRNDDPSMALFGVGLGLLTVVHGLLKLASDLLTGLVAADPETVIVGFAVASQVVDIVGLVAVFYALFD